MRIQTHRWLCAGRLPDGHSTRHSCTYQNRSVFLSARQSAAPASHSSDRNAPPEGSLLPWTVIPSEHSSGSTISRCSLILRASEPPCRILSPVFSGCGPALSACLSSPTPLLRGTSKLIPLLLFAESSIFVAPPTLLIFVRGVFSTVI